MGEKACGAGFTMKTLADPWIEGQMSVEHLDRDHLFALRIARAVHSSHRAFTDEGLDFISSCEGATDHGNGIPARPYGQVHS